MRDRAWRRSWCDAAAASVLAFGRCGSDCRSARCGGRSLRRWARLCLRGRLGRKLRRLGELHRPGRLLAGIDLEETGAVIAARQAVGVAVDGELLVARAHEGLPGPFAAVIVVDRV